MTSLKLQAPAKINLHLSILGKREDGYHNLFMLMEKVSLYDEIHLEKISSGVELSEVGNRKWEIGKEQNLCFRAAKLIQKVSGSGYGVRIGLKKNIPVGAGLGGGSSNAATVLKGLNELWGLYWPLEKLAPLGLKLGADVPFFLHDGPAKVEGMGERITPVGNLPKLWIILINPGIDVSTPLAYWGWDKTKFRKELTLKNRSASVPRTFSEVTQILHNDFEEVVIPSYPEIQNAKDTLRGVKAKGTLMSGSGSTVFGLFQSQEERDRAMSALDRRPKWNIFAVENGCDLPVRPLFFAG